MLECIMPLIIQKKEIKNWLDSFKGNFKVIQTKKSILPVKQYFFPPREDIFIFNKKNSKLTTPKFEKNLFVLCSHLGELEAMTQLDEIMGGEKPDYYYWQRRERSVLVGLIEESVEVAPGGDLILEKINSEQYQALILNNKGQKLIKKEFFKEVKKPKVKKYSTEKKKLKELLLDPELLSNAVSWSWKSNHKIWDELGKKCLGCGVCTYVCPICHCFSIEDSVALDDSECIRCREWDACTLPKFAQVAGKHNFHKTIKERYYNWYYHKFVRAYKEFGRSQCVACGQCGRNCPAGISIEEILIEIVNDYNKDR